MKLKLMTKLVLLAGLLVGFAPVAQAFYNPSTGRWLSRDPMAETGFVSGGLAVFASREIDKLNLYNFAINSPVNWFDRFGLDCECGPDVTDALNATLNEVAQKFAALGAFDKLKACGAVAGVGGNAASAWDINTLAYTSPNYQEQYPDYKDPLEKGGNSHCCPRSCADTVVVNGQCVFSHQATYALFGKIGELCSFPPAALHAAIDAWKQQRYPKADKVFTDHAHAMTDYGNGQGFPGDFEGLGCTIYSAHEKTSLDIFKWTWEPFQPRSHEP